MNLGKVLVSLYGLLRNTQHAIRITLPVTLLGCAGSAAVPAAAQTVSVEAQQAPLREVLPQLERQTGYAFRLALDPRPDKQIDNDGEDARCDVHWNTIPLFTALSELATRFKCDFFSADAAGFFVIPAAKPPDRETPVGPYRLHVNRPAPTEEKGVLELTLAFTGPDEERLESIAGLGGDLRIVDNFGRLLLPPGGSPLWSTRALRTRLTEYSRPLRLTLPDGRAARIRSISGTLVLYRKLTPLRFEFPLNRAEQPQTLTQQGLEFRLERSAVAGRDFMVSTRLAWSDDRNVVGRGISRTPLPYLVDENGRVYRDWKPRLSRSGDPGGRSILAQQVRFEAVSARPVKVVYEVLLRQEPDLTLPFRIADLPLPRQAPAAQERQQGPFYAADGGTISLQVIDRDGRPLEGEVSLGLSRKEQNGWTGPRWIEVVTDPGGRARLEQVQPGLYRVSRRFRLDPAKPPVPGPRETTEITVTPGGEARLPPLKLPIQAPPEP